MDEMPGDKVEHISETEKIDKHPVAIVSFGFGQNSL